jgi:hypothetical protein
MLYLLLSGVKTFKVKYIVRSESPEKVSLSISELAKVLVESYGGDYVKVGLSLIWSHNDLIIKTMVRDLRTPTIPSFYEFEVIIEGVRGEELIKLSKTVVSVLRKYELLITISE